VPWSPHSGRGAESSVGLETARGDYLVYAGDRSLGGSVSELNAWSRQCRLLRTEVEDQLVDLLADAPEFQGETSRRQLVARAERLAGVPLQVPENPMRRQWFYGLVEECARGRTGLAHLGGSVRALADESSLAAGVTHLIDCWDTADTAATAVIPWQGSAEDGPGTRVVNVWDALRTTLSGWPAADVQPQFQLATEDRETAAPWYCDTGWQVFVSLVNRTATRGLPPPYLVFLDRLIHDNRLDRGLEPLVEIWIRRVATEHGCLAELEGMRQRRADPLVGRSPVHLVLRLEGAGPGRDRYDLFWCLERYRPRRVVDGGERHERLGRDEIEGVVSTVVRRAEQILSTTSDPLALEFVLPFELLDLDIEWWRKEERYGPSKPLVLDYSVTLRSLERLDLSEWHREWRRRWRHVELPADTVTYWCGPRTQVDGLGLEAELRANEQLIALVLSGPPRIGSRGMDELVAGLRTGIAGIIWRRLDGPAAAETDESLRGCLNGHRAADLPHAVRLLRLDAQRLPDDVRSGHLGRQLVLLWDDPLRIDVPGGT
jgi:vWA-MoxR associated protein C-terminal domain/Effector-associated domain 2/vWA-MoxR associated protein middle region 0